MVHGELHSHLHAPLPVQTTVAVLTHLETLVRLAEPESRGFCQGIVQTTVAGNDLSMASHNLEEGERSGNCHR